MAVELRDARSDPGILGRLERLNRTWNTGVGLPFLDDDDAETLTDPAWRAIVATVGPATVGFVVGRDHGTVAHLDVVAVQPRRRRHGIGAELVIAFAESLSPSHEIGLAAIAGDDQQAWALRGFYERVGFSLQADQEFPGVAVSYTAAASEIRTAPAIASLR